MTIYTTPRLQRTRQAARLVQQQRSARLRWLGICQAARRQAARLAAEEAGR